MPTLTGKLTRFTSLVLVVTSFLAACTTASPTPTASSSLAAAATSPAPPATATLTPTPSLPPTQTRTPTPTRTAVPTDIPITPVLQGTRLPQSGPAISAGNADRLTLLARWGLGNPGDIAYTPDERYLIAASTTGVYFFDPADYTLSKQIDTPYIAWHLAVSPDSQMLAVAGPETVYIYQISDLQLLKSFAAQANSLDFSPDGQVLAIGISGGRTSRIQFRDVGTWTVQSTLESDMGIWSIEFSPRGDVIASAGNSTKVWFVDGTLTAEQGPYNSGGMISDISFSPDGNLLAEGSDYDIHIWRVLDNGRLTGYRQIDLSRFNYSMVMAVSISPDGTMVAAALTQGIFIWNLESGLSVFGVEAAFTHYNSLAWSADSRHISAASPESGVQVWDVRTEQAIASLHQHSGGLNALAWSADGQILAAGAAEGRGYLINALNGELLHRVGSGYSLNRLAISPDSLMLAIGYYDRLVQFWTMDGVLTHTLEGYGYGAPDSQFSANGAFFAAILSDNWLVDQVRLWNTQDWSIAGTFSVGNKEDFRIAGLSLAPDQQSIAIVVADSSHVTNRIYIQILTIPDGVLVATLEHSGLNLSGQTTAFSPSGEMLASYSPERTSDYGRLQVWRTSDWQWLYNYDVMPERIERGHAGRIAGSLAWSPDSTLLAVGVTDGTIQILRADTGELLITLPGHRMWAPAVVFSPDGRLLASCSLDGTIMLWGTR